MRGPLQPALPGPAEGLQVALAVDAGSPAAGLAVEAPWDAEGEGDAALAALEAAWAAALGAALHLAAAMAAAGPGKAAAYPRGQRARSSRQVVLRKAL